MGNIPNKNRGNKKKEKKHPKGDSFLTIRWAKFIMIELMDIGEQRPNQISHRHGGIRVENEIVHIGSMATSLSNA